MLIDSHCHLDYFDTQDERDAVVERAIEAGVARMVTICTQLDRFDSCYAIAQRYPQVYCAVGLHPNHVSAETMISSEQPLLEIAENEKVVGIGESGLDYHYDYAPQSVQKQSFELHIKAAQQTKLPLIVHARNADHDIIALLEKHYAKAPFACVIHCFSSGRSLAHAAIDMGFYISISGIATFKKSSDLRAILDEVPKERLLVETDAPYLAPQPKRGKRNEPAYVAMTAQIMADYFGMDEQEFISLTGQNFLRLFTKVPQVLPV